MLIIKGKEESIVKDSAVIDLKTVTGRDGI
jgi:hypothetical protein